MSKKYVYLILFSGIFLFSVIAGIVLGSCDWFKKESHIPVEQESVETEDQNSEEELVIFHNGTGPMCIEALEFFDSMDYEYTQYLNTDTQYSTKLGEYRQGFNVSEGISTSFGYYPIIFVGDRVFSGFNDEIKEQISDILE